VNIRAKAELSFETGYKYFLLFCSCDILADLMTLIYEPDLIILKMYLLARMNFLGQGFRKLEYYRHMNAREKITTQHSRAVKRLVTTRHDFVTAIKATRFVTSSHL